MCRNETKRSLCRGERICTYVYFSNPSPPKCLDQIWSNESFQGNYGFNKSWSGFQIQYKKELSKKKQKYVCWPKNLVFLNKKVHAYIVHHQSHFSWLIYEVFLLIFFLQAFFTNLRSWQRNPFTLKWRDEAILYK